MQKNEGLVHYLISSGHLNSRPVIAAFRSVDRANFVEDDLKEQAYLDKPLPLIADQTISQPSVVAFMLKQLAATPGKKILDIGFGSGWTTALLCHIVGRTGRVYALEYNQEVYSFGSYNLKRYQYPQLQLFNRSGWEGLKEAAPYDGILVSASANRVPKSLVTQLAQPGRLVIPVKNSIMRIDKTGDGGLNQREFPGFVFVPFIEKG